MSEEDRSRKKILERGEKLSARDREVMLQMGEDPIGQPPDPPPGTPPAPRDVVEKSLQRHGPSVGQVEPPTPLSDPSLDEIEVGQAIEDSELWLDEQWRKQRHANLAHGIISMRDSRVYKQAIKRDIDGDVIPEPENLKKLEAVQKIMPRPQGWLPPNVRSVFPRLPSFVRRLMEKVSGAGLDKEAK